MLKDRSDQPPMESPIPGDPFELTHEPTEIGAIDMWRRELRAGVDGQDPWRPETLKRDTLYEAAGYEYHARVARAAGIHGAAKACLIVAAQLMVRLNDERTARALELVRDEEIPA